MQAGPGVPPVGRFRRMHVRDIAVDGCPLRYPVRALRHRPRGPEAPRPLRRRTRPAERRRCAVPGQVLHARRFRSLGLRLGVWPAPQGGGPAASEAPRPPPAPQSSRRTPPVRRAWASPACPAVSQSRPASRSPVPASRRPPASPTAPRPPPAPRSPRRKSPVRCPRARPRCWAAPRPPPPARRAGSGPRASRRPRSGRRDRS